MEPCPFSELAGHIFESLYYFIVMDTEERIAYINRAYAEFLGSNPEDLVGQPITKVIPNTRLPLVLHSEKNELGSYISIENQETGESIQSICNRILIRRNGTTDGEILGVMAEGVIRDFQDIDSIRMEAEQLRTQNRLYKTYLSEVFQAPYSIDSILGHSQAILELKKIISRVARSQISVCITGETGTGKELVANAIHQYSGRTDGPFIKINCAAIPKELLEAELFGYEAGAFTGADRKGKIGKFELANHGTLLLDEIGEMPLTLQSKILRVLQEKEIERIGGARAIPLDVRVICSTNRDLPQMIREGKFRADLYYRINTMELTVPPLRDRLDDLDVLCPHFIRLANERNGVAIQGLSPEVYELFYSYTWPGNIRELEHTIERAGVMQGYGVLQEDQFQFLKNRISINSDSEISAPASMRTQKERLERHAIQDALRICQGNKAAAARYLQMDRSALYLKLKKYGL